MGFVHNEPLLAKRKFKSFSFPLVLIALLILVLFFEETVFTTTNSYRVNKGLTEKLLLNEIMRIGTDVMETSLRLHGIGGVGSGSFRERIQTNPTLYLDMNGDGITDSLVLYTFIDISSTKIEFVLTAYRLKRSVCGTTNLPWLTMKMDPISTKLVKVLSNDFSTNTQVSKYIRYSLKIENTISVLDQVFLEKKLNLVFND